MHALLQVLEWIGLLIAALDFFEFSPKIQAWIDTGRYRFFIWLDERGNERFLAGNAVAGTISLASCVLFAWFWYAYLTHAPNAMAIFGWWLLAGMGPFVMFFVLIPLLYNLLLILNKSPSKTIGTVAFALALASSGLQAVWEHTHPCLPG